jgi:hypothetical protein
MESLRGPTIGLRSCPFTVLDSSTPIQFVRKAYNGAKQEFFRQL